MTKYKVYCFGYKVDFDLWAAFDECLSKRTELESEGYFYEIRDVVKGKDFLLIELRKLQVSDLPNKSKRKQADQSLALGKDEGVTTRAWMVFDLKANFFGSLNTRVAGPSRLVAMLAMNGKHLSTNHFIKPEAWARIKTREKDIIGLEVNVSSINTDPQGTGWDQRALAAAAALSADTAKLYFGVNRGKHPLTNPLAGLKRLLNIGVKSAKVKFSKNPIMPEEDLLINLLQDQLSYSFESDYKAVSMSREDAYGHLKNALRHFREVQS